MKAVKGTSDTERFAAFPYGEALKKCGDTESIEGLRTHLREAEPPPNVFAWIRQIIKAIEKAREDSEREVGHGWNAIIEHFYGVLESGSQSCEATLHLWKVPNEDFVNLGSWGGTAALAEDSAGASAFASMFDRGYVTVGGAGRCTGNALITKTKHDQVFIIKGSGPYPSKVQG